VENGPSLKPLVLDNSETKEPSAKNLEGNLCYVMEWYRERLPHEYNGGTILSMDRKATPKKEKILIFADSWGVCPNERTGAKGFMDWAPEDRVGEVKIVSTPPGEITQKEMLAAVDSKQWDIIVWGYSCENAPLGCTDVTVVTKLQDDVQRLLLALCQHLQIVKKTNRLAVLTLGAFSHEPLEHEHYGIHLITHANTIGFCNAVRQEVAEAFRLHYFDCPNDTPSMGIDVMSEIFREEGFGTNNVRLSPPGPDEPNEHYASVEGRFVQRMATSKLYAERKFRWLLPKKGTVLITGGNGSLGLIMGKWLQSQAERSPYKHPLTLLFLSRSMKISAGDNQRMWDEIQAGAVKLGMTVQQVSCDFSDQAAVDAFIGQHSPHIAGVIHSAGVLRDSTIRNQTWDKFREVYQPKSHAALYVHEALLKHANPGLAFYWMFSSIAVHGSMGQSNYAGSNAMLDGIARHRRALGLPGMTVQWGAWGEAGMAASMDAVNRKRVNDGPMPFFTNKEGLQGLEAGLLTDMPTFSVFKYNIEFLLNSADTPPDSAIIQFMQNQAQKIAAPRHLDQCGRIAFQRNMTMPSKMLLCPKFTFNDYPKETGEPPYQGDDGGLVYL